MQIIFEGKNKEEEIHNRYNVIIKKTEYYDYINYKLIIVDTNLRISWDNYFINKFFIEGFDAGKIIDYEFTIQPIGSGKILIRIGIIGIVMQEKVFLYIKLIIKYLNF